MKSLLFFVLLISFACNKPATDLGSEYQYLVGEWENNSEPKTYASFKKNGKTIIEIEAQRGTKAKLEKLYTQEEVLYNNQNFLLLIYGGGNDAFYLLKKPGIVDTIFIRAVFVESDTLSEEYITVIRKK